MPKLPVLSGRELIRLPVKAAFRETRQRGSHIRLEKGSIKTVVPLHDDLSKGTLLGILDQCGLSRDDLPRLLKR